MTLHKPHAGDGYTYLTRQVAAGDEGRSPGQELTDYYTASGNPPGRWLGSGAADLQVTGRVREDQMRSLFGRGLHPDAEEIVALETAAGTSPEAAERAVKLGRAFPRYQPLPLRAERVAARLSDWEREQGRPPAPVVRSTIEAQEARKDRRAVAGYDLVVTPVKSASLLWALGSSSTREAVEDVHREAPAFPNRPRRPRTRSPCSPAGSPARPAHPSIDPPTSDDPESLNGPNRGPRPRSRRAATGKGRQNVCVARPRPLVGMENPLRTRLVVPWERNNSVGAGATVCAHRLASEG
jgi:hypothetical protein